MPLTIETMQDVKLLWFMLTNGYYETFIPREEDLLDHYAIIKRIMRRMAEVDKEEQIVHLEVDHSVTCKDKQPYLRLWKASVWRTTQQRKDNLRVSVQKAHYASKQQEAKVNILTTRIRNRLGLPGGETDDYPRVLAMKAVLDNDAPTKGIIAAMGVTFEYWEDKEVENPDEYI